MCDLVFCNMAARLIFLAFIFPGSIYSQAVNSAYTDSLVRLADKAMLYQADSGLFYAGLLLDYANEMDSEYVKALAYEKMGWSYWVKGNYAEGLRYSLDAVRILEDKEPSPVLATALLAAGRNLFEQKSYELAQKYYSRAEKIALSLQLLPALLEAYRDIGGLNIYTDNYDLGIAYCEKGIALAKEIGDRESLPIFNSHLALLYQKKGDMDRAVDYNWKAILEGRLAGNRRIVALCFERLAGFDIENGNYKEAIRKAEEALEMSHGIGSSLLMMHASLVLSKGYEGIGQYQKALDYYKKYSVISDSTYNAGKEAIIVSMEAVYNLERKQQDIELLEKEKALTEQAAKAQQYYFLLLMVVIILLIFLILLLYTSFLNKNRHNRQLKLKNEEIKRQADKLSEMNAAKSMIFSIIGHDLRSSMANLKQLMGLIHSQDMSVDELKSITPSIKHSVDSSFDVLDNLLHWGLSQMNGIKTNIHPADAGALSAEIVNHFSQAATNKNIRLRSEIPAGQLVLADASQLSVVIRNLVANAVKFTQTGGEIVIKTYDKNDTVRIAVIDSGVGISEEKQKLMFKSDSHFTETGTSQEKGSGLGLILCKEFLENMGSYLHVESTPGQGSTFYFELKRAVLEQAVQ